MRNNTISIVIGSWGSYNECNERALGSKWICLNDYEEWEEILEELENQGFELNGIDEELFVQDIENFPANVGNWDYVNPQTLFETLKKSGILDDDDKYEKMEIYCDIEGYDAWVHLVDQYEENWDDDIYLYRFTPNSITSTISLAIPYVYTSATSRAASKICSPANSATSPNKSSSVL